MGFLERVVSAVVLDNLFETGWIIHGALACGALGRKALDGIGANDPWIGEELPDLRVGANARAGGDECTHRGAGKHIGQKGVLEQSFDDAKVEETQRRAPRKHER